jgi:Uma2 family endonuclease
MSFVYDNYLTFEQFASISDSIRENTGKFTEYSNGEIIYFSPKARHSVSINNIIALLRNKLPNKCVAISELHIKFNEKEYRVPDVSVFCGKDIEDKYNNDLLYLEIPKLIFEVLSEGTEKNDKEYKMRLYAEKGIEEYILVDYNNNTVEQYYLNDNKYKLNKRYENDDVCKLLLYPEVKFITSDIFNLFLK